MGKEVHYIPVGFDYERLLQPLFKGDFDPDRIILVESSKDPAESREATLAKEITEDIRESATKTLGLNVDVIAVDDMYNYQGIFEFAYKELAEKIQLEKEIFVNISSMPRTVAFAFATAVDTHVLEAPHLRDSLHTYYVSPEKYLMVDVLEMLEEQKEYLENAREEGSFHDIDEQLDDITDILQKLQSGTTTGPRELSDGKLHVEFVAPPVIDLKPYEEELLKIVDNKGTVESISELARLHADQNGVMCNSSFINKTRYRIDNLEETGLVKKYENGQKHEIRLTRIGEMWSATT